MNLLLEEFKQLLLILLKHEVRFVLIGGYVVIYYGYGRTTNDLDILLEATNENRDKLISALNEFGIEDESLAFLSEADLTKIQFFFFGEKPERVEFLTKITNVTFEEASAAANYFPLKDTKVPILNYHHLILSKISNGRAKDDADVEELQKINRNREKPL